MNNTIFLFFYSLAHKSNIFDNIVIFSAVYFPYIVVVSAILFLLFHHEIFDAVNWIFLCSEVDDKETIDLCEKLLDNVKQDTVKER